jgi:hypothetical protein
VASGVASRILKAAISAAPRERVFLMAENTLDRLSVLGKSAGLDAAGREKLDTSLGIAAASAVDLLSDPAVFSQNVLASARILGEVASPSNLQSAIINEAQPAPIWAPKWAETGSKTSLIDAAFGVLSETALAISLIEVMMRRDFPSRPDAVAARAAVSTAIDRVRQKLSGTEASAAQVFSNIEAAVSSYISLLAADLRPLVEIRAQASLPALVWAWKLYADPHRVADLVARANVPHPGFMPLKFEAVAPNVA